ncbi:unnamed protein product [Penicillium pancosmium]
MMTMFQLLPQETGDAGIWAANLAFVPCGSDIVGASTPSYAADQGALPAATEELHELMNKPTLDGIPLLVLGNKSDLPVKLSVDELIDAMDLKSITHREVSCYGISAKEETNLDAVLHWLIARASR